MTGAKKDYILNRKKKGGFRVKKGISIFLSLLLMVAFVLPISSGTTVAEGESVWDGVAAASFAGGTGIETDPYLISNAAELAYLADMVNSGTDFQGEYIKLNADITLNDMGNWRRWTVDISAESGIIPSNLWTPVGAAQNTAFMGTFDGDMHVVQGVYMNSGALQGLFGCIGQNAIVKNLGVINSLFGAGTDVGSVAALNLGTMYRCYFNGKLRMRGDNAGGLVAVNCGRLEECFNTGSLLGRATNVGGITGVNSGTILNCFNSGMLVGVATYCGGAIGVNSGLVQNSYNSGFTRGSASASGGVAAVNNGGTFENCYYTAGGMGAIGFDTQTGMYLIDAPAVADYIEYDSRTLAEAYAGFDFTENPIWTMDGASIYAFAELNWMPHPADFARGDGSVYSPYEIETYGQLCFFRDAVNAGDSFYGSTIVLNAYINSEGDLEAWTPIGYLEGYAFAGHFDGKNNQIGGLTINSYYGGLFGFTRAEAVIHDVAVYDATITGTVCGGIVSTNNGTVYNCTMTNCTITATGASNMYAGGIVGRNQSTGVVHDCKNASRIQAQYAAGGIVGQNAGSVSDCLSISTVTGQTGEGGTVGENSHGTVSGCFYLEGTAAGGIGGADAEGQSEGKTSEVLMARSTYDDWNFITAWKHSGMNYPWLENRIMVSTRGAQARTDGSAIRFGAEINYLDLMAGMRVGDTLELGFYTRAAATYLNDNSSLIKTAWPTVTWTQELAETTSCQQLVALLRAEGLPIFSCENTSFTYVLIGTNMTDYAQMDVVFMSYVKVNDSEYRGSIFSNSVWKILGGVPSMEVIPGV